MSLCTVTEESMASTPWSRKLSFRRGSSRSSSSSSSSSLTEITADNQRRMSIRTAMERSVSTEDILSKVMEKQGPYVTQLVEYFSHKTSCRFGLEILYNQPTFFVSDEELLRQMNDRSEWETIGRGGFGSVYKASWLGVDVAVKLLHSKRTSRFSFDIDDPTVTASDFIVPYEGHSDSLCEGLMELFEEFELGRRIRHPQIANFYIASPHMYVLEYMQNGSLSRFMQSSSVVSDEVKHKWCKQIAKAVKYLHHFDMVHSDISLDNILLDEYQNAKLIDVGGAYIISDGAQPTYKIVSDRYIPLRHHALDATESERLLGPNSDKYALSIVCFSIATWSIDVFAMLNIPFFERQLNETSTLEEREKLVKDAQEKATIAVHSILSSCSWMSEACKETLLNWFLQSLSDSNDFDTLIK